MKLLPSSSTLHYKKRYMDIYGCDKLYGNNEVLKCMLHWKQDSLFGKSI